MLRSCHLVSDTKVPAERESRNVFTGHVLIASSRAMTADLVKIVLSLHNKRTSLIEAARCMQYAD